MQTRLAKRIISDEVGKCEKCGKFQRWADMGHMKPDGSVILCQVCIRKSIEADRQQENVLSETNDLPATAKPRPGLRDA